LKVTVYGAASNRIDDKYIKDGFELGKRLGERGHSMVFGAGSDGLMGAVARGFKSVGAFVHGVIPTFFEENGYEKIFYEADKITYTETMAERKAIMEDNADAFVITPGGIGTYEEFFQIITLKQLGRHQKAIALFNSHGYFDDLKKLLEDAIGMGFVNNECKKLALFFDDMDELIDYIENYNTDDIEWNLLKR
jgi:uncharacterized protein (TIGR00730 family)